MNETLKGCLFFIPWVGAPIAAATLTGFILQRLWLEPECRERCAAIGEQSHGAGRFVEKFGKGQGCACEHTRLGWGGPEGATMLSVVAYFAASGSMIWLVRRRKRPGQA